MMKELRENAAFLVSKLIEEEWMPTYRFFFIPLLKLRSFKREVDGKATERLTPKDCSMAASACRACQKRKYKE